VSQTPSGDDKRIPGTGLAAISVRRDRPEEIEGRLVPGHWEGDPIKGAFNRSAVGTVVECRVALKSETARVGGSGQKLVVRQRGAIRKVFRRGLRLW
jgi:IS30 family transposase